MGMWTEDRRCFVVGGQEEPRAWWQVCVAQAFSTSSLTPSSTSSGNCHSPRRLGLSTLVSRVATQTFSLCLSDWFFLLPRLLLPHPTPSMAFFPPFRPQMSPPQKPPSPFLKEPILCPVPLPCLLNVLHSTDHDYNHATCWSAGLLVVSLTGV